MKQNSDRRIGIFVIDDHPLVRDGLQLILEQGDFAVTGAADSLEPAKDHPGLQSAQVVVLDLSLEQESGMELIAPFCQRGLRVLVYSMHEEPAIVRRALAAGATGYVTKREVAYSLSEAIHAMLRGDTYLSPRAAGALAEAVPELNLSRQQQELYDLLGKGCDVAEIAAALEVSPRTVESYCVRLMDKLGVHGMKELRRRAITQRQRSL